ncbi:hypothetical protein RJ639_000899 [Escallonia herrerae]|uniref:ATP-dependent zinc metalloprotease n=1 Tax=Escallonia herrerae TaxID=1293975 RepID=A0AA89BN09_9ASTE|nr:hypothetical protein RJ639_000899 [Escallonia herrerae]
MTRSIIAKPSPSKVDLEARGSNGYFPLFHEHHPFVFLLKSNGVTYRPFQFPLPALPLAETKHFTHKQFLCKALTGWQEYEDAVKNKDLARALRFLKNIPAVPDESPIELTQSRVDAGGLGLIGLDRNWEVLDTCLNADDMRLVGSVYGFLQKRGFLPNFGKYRSIVLEGPRNVTPNVLKSSTGLEGAVPPFISTYPSLLKLFQTFTKEVGLSSSSTVPLVALLAGISFLLNQGIDIRPNLAAILGLAMMDSIFLGGSCLAQISSYWPPYKSRILVHEAGHLLIAYLMGCPIRGVILDPIVAMQMGIQGQAGTQFWDEKLQNDLAGGRLIGTAFDSSLICIVHNDQILHGSFRADIAAETLVYGEAEGGENDENLFRNICLLLDPPLVVAQMSHQARWSVLQSYNMLKWHKRAHRAAVKALESGGSLSMVIRRIEEAMSCSE